MKLDGFGFLQELDDVRGDSASQAADFENERRFNFVDAAADYRIPQRIKIAAVPVRRANRRQQHLKKLFTRAAAGRLDDYYLPPLRIAHSVRVPRMNIVFSAMAGVVSTASPIGFSASCSYFAPGLKT